ncbi:hypothetical protein BDK51DRAFT_41752 [Blyttiomyces helicus]|uniref:EGF-like domain-containing protein n=1 Tax=Blyttiomyces helicus TaxID=388810 RepID=A0A4P9WIU0_9FUNG|nr:hypothetical protein BDK51DRAFT_41752 [Blyttiomyces helicus]|eukprot:RKO91945.1 hypothetical protein BDK51DRAFT_41752 [Blyttiomyces helicus]
MAFAASPLYILAVGLLLHCSVAYAAQPCMNNNPNGVPIFLNSSYGYGWTPNSNCTMYVTPVRPDGQPVTSITFNVFEIRANRNSAFIHPSHLVRTPPPLPKPPIPHSTTSLDPSALVASFTGQTGGNITVNASDALVQFVGVLVGTLDGGAFFYYTNDGVDVPWDELECPFDCYGHGVCVRGKCVCDEGYEGGLCKNDDRFQLNQPSFWTGVQCASGRIDEVYLRGKNLSCPNGLPGSAAWYASIWDLSDNSIGVVPDSWFFGTNGTGITTLVNFSRAWLVNDLNQGYGAVHFMQAGLNVLFPSGLPKIPSRITSLDISSNNLTGVFPNSLGDATSRMLYLEDNRFYGTLPIGFFFFQPGSIFLAGNQATYCRRKVRAGKDGGSEVVADADADSSASLFAGIVSLVSLYYSRPLFAFKRRDSQLGVASATPLWVSAGGGTTMTVFGEGFMDVDGFQCLFGTTAVPAKVHSSTIMECTMPRVLPGNVSVEVAFHGQRISKEGAVVTAMAECATGYYRQLEVEDCIVCPGKVDS